MKHANRSPEWLQKRIARAGFVLQQDGTLTRRLVLPFSQRSLEAVLTHVDGDPVRTLDHPVRLVVRQCIAPHDVISGQQLATFATADFYLRDLEHTEARKRAEADFLARYSNPAPTAGPISHAAAHSATSAPPGTDCSGV